MLLCSFLCSGGGLGVAARIGTRVSEELAESCSRRFLELSLVPVYEIGASTITRPILPPLAHVCWSRGLLGSEIGFFSAFREEVME